jgi:hypothetical protein
LGFLIYFSLYSVLDQVLGISEHSYLNILLLENAAALLGKLLGRLKFKSTKAFNA